MEIEVIRFVLIISKYNNEKAKVTDAKKGTKKEPARDDYVPEPG